MAANILLKKRRKKAISFDIFEQEKPHHSQSLSTCWKQLITYVHNMYHYLQFNFNQKLHNVTILETITPPSPTPPPPGPLRLRLQQRAQRWTSRALLALGSLVLVSRALNTSHFTLISLSLVSVTPTVYHVGHVRGERIWQHSKWLQFNLGNGF